METSPYPVWASQALAVVAAPAPEAQAVQRPKAEAEEAAEDVPAAPMNLAQEEDNHEEKTQVASIMRSMSWVRCGRIGPTSARTPQRTAR